MSFCELPNVKATKAYKNTDFLNSQSARNIRIQCEFAEPEKRLKEHGVENIVMFFGSARAKNRVDYEMALLDKTQSPEQLEKLKKQEFLIDYFEKTIELAKRLTEWSLSREENLPKYVVGTGGGPGMMTAANHGAYKAGGPSVGFGISVPFEDGLNPFVTPELAFEFHYFFTRKFWMAYKCSGLVVAPGGLGTCDELFELLTLMQTKKIKHVVPIVLFGTKFWHSVLNFDKLIEFGMILPSDLDTMLVTDDVEEALEHLKKFILKNEEVNPRTV